MPFILGNEEFINFVIPSITNIFNISLPSLIDLLIEKLFLAGIGYAIVSILCHFFSYYDATKIKDLILSAIYPILSIFSHK